MAKIFLYIDSMQRGGAQRVMSNLSSNFVSNGNQVFLINDIIPDPNKKEYEINNNVKRLFLDRGRKRYHIKNLYRISVLRSLLKKEKPDVIISFLGPPNIRMLISSIGLKTRKIVSVRNDPNMEYGIGLKKTLTNLVFGLSDGYVFQTEDAAAYFSKKIRRKSRIIFNPVNDVFYKSHWIGDKNEIAVVGRLHPQKNPLLALKAFYKISSKYPDYKIVYYGDDELSDKIKSLSLKMGISDQVIIFGKTTDVADKLVHASIFLLSSDYEGMPNALMEAMAIGTPIVSTDCPCGGPRMIVLNKKQGLLVKVGDEEDMANALDTLLANRELRDTMSVNEQKRALDFHPSIIMQQWNDYVFKHE